MLKIWGRANAPNVIKVLWACEELGLAYERVDWGGPFGGNRDPVYLRRNPNGLIPTLEEDDGFTLWESSAIIRYLTAKDPDQRLMPRSLRGRALADQWTDWQIAHQGQAVRGLVMLVRRPGRPAAEAEMQAAGDAAGEAMAHLDRRLQESPYLAGDAISFADIPNGVAVHRWKTLPVARPAFPALDAWHDGLSARPAFAKVVRFEG